MVSSRSRCPAWAPVPIGLFGLSLWSATLFALEPGGPMLVTRNYHDGGPAPGFCSNPRFAESSRYLGFSCLTETLVPGDHNGEYDVFMVDRATGVIQRASLNSQGGEGEGYKSGSAWIRPSADGAVAVFGSTVRLHEDQPMPPFLTPGPSAVFLRRFATGQTDLLSRDATGAVVTQSVRFEDASPSGHEVLVRTNVDLRDGTVVPFISHIWVRNWKTGSVELVSARPDGDLANNGNISARFSNDARLVVFISAATDLGTPVRPGDANIFVRDRVLGVTERVTYAPGGGEFTGDPVSFAGAGPQISADGRHVLFISSSPTFHPPGFPVEGGGAQVYLADRETGDIELVSRDLDGQFHPGFSLSAAMSADARYVAYDLRWPFVYPATAHKAIHVLDRQTGVRVDVTEPLGTHAASIPQLSMDMSADGSLLAFNWRATSPALPPEYGWEQIYTVDLGTRGSPRPPRPDYQPVPWGSPWSLWLLVTAFIVLAWRRYQRNDVGRITGNCVKAG